MTAIHLSRWHIHMSRAWNNLCAFLFSSRRLLPAGLAGLLMGVVAANGYAVTNPIQPGKFTVRLRTVDKLPSSAGAPLWGTHAADDRLFVAGQRGEVWILQDGKFLDTPFFDTGDVEDSLSLIAGGELGLLGIAFHPNYDRSGTPGKGLFYTYTSESIGDNTPDFYHPELGPTGGSNHSVIRQWQVDPNDTNRIDHASSRILMRIQQPQGNHNGGAMVFDPSGNLYIALGDGGGGNDQKGGLGNPNDGHTNPSGDDVPHGNGQDRSNILGSIIRIDPLGSNSASGQYGIPTDNPFVGQAGIVEEIWAYGLRNPFRMSFDRETGQLWTGDVGQGQREEVNLILPGLNYGWVTREGTRDNFPYDTEGLVDPVGEYTHGEGRAVIGGFVYRGSELGALRGTYVFGDLGLGGGRLFTMDTSTGLIEQLKLAPGGDAIPGALHGFGEDAGGELYALFSSRDVVKLVPEPGTYALALWMIVAMMFLARGASDLKGTSAPRFLADASGRDGGSTWRGR